MLNYQNTEFKSLEELKETTPSIFTRTSSESTSDKYTHIPTDTVIRDLELLGWGVVDAKEVKARKDTTKGFQKHLVVLRNPDVVIDGADGDTVYPQILLTNSHDGKNSFSLSIITGLSPSKAKISCALNPYLALPWGVSPSLDFLKLYLIGF